MIYEKLQLLASASIHPSRAVFVAGSDSGFGENFGEVAPPGADGSWSFSTSPSHNCSQHCLRYRVVLQQGKVKVTLWDFSKNTHEFVLSDKTNIILDLTSDWIRITGHRCLETRLVEAPTSHPSILCRFQSLSSGRKPVHENSSAFSSARVLQPSSMT